MTIAARRTRLGLSVRDVAQRLGVPPRKVEAWEAGEALPYRRHRVALGAVLGWTEEQVCKGLPTYAKAIESRTQQLIRAHGKQRPEDGPGSDKWMRDQLEKMRAQAR